MNTDIYIIEYKLHGKPKSFIVRTRIQNNADAWHWASCDAGVAPIPKPGALHSRSSLSRRLRGMGFRT